MKSFVYKIMSLALVVLSLSSCLKDKPNNLDPSGSSNVVEFRNVQAAAAVVGSVYPTYINSLDVAPTGSIPVTIGYSGPENVAPNDITVNLALGTEAMVTAYNDEQETEYELIESSLYEGIPASVVIPKGQQTVTFNINFKPSSFDLSTVYALPLQITGVSSSQVSGNFGKIIIAVSAKNKYDGKYSYVFSMLAPDRPSFAANGTEYTWPGDVTLRTSGANTVNLFDEWGFGAFIQPLRTSTGWNGLGQTNPRFTIDEATNKITEVINSTNATNGRKFNIDPTGVNEYNPATKNITATYFMTQPGFAPIKIVSKFTYKGPR